MRQCSLCRQLHDREYKIGDFKFENFLGEISEVLSRAEL